MKKILGSLKGALSVLSGKSTATPSTQLPASARKKKMLTLYQDTINRICNSFVPVSHTAQPYPAKFIIDRLLLFVLDLPLSPSSPESLFAYSLRVADYSLTEYASQPLWRMETPEGTRDDEKSMQMQAQWKLGVLIAALTYNLGQVYNLEVSNVPRTHLEETEIWLPSQEGFYAFISRHKEYNIRWKEPLMKGASHKAPIGYLLPHIIDNEIIKILDYEVFFEVLDVLSIVPRGDNRIFSVVEEGEEAAKREVLPAQRRIAAQEDIVQDFCSAIKRLYTGIDSRTNKKWTVPNVKGSYLLICHEYTALNLGGDIVSAEQVENPIEVAMKSMTSPVDDERLKKALLKTGTVFFLEQNMYFQAKILFPGETGEVKRSVVLVKNSVLWQSEKGLPFFQGLLELATREVKFGEKKQIEQLMVVMNAALFEKEDKGKENEKKK